MVKFHEDVCAFIVSEIKNINFNRIKYNFIEFFMKFLVVLRFEVSFLP